jgi:hypothetical protein
LFFTYLGGSDMDLAHALTADSTGVYITGITFSPDFPTYFGTCKRGANDVFVTKLTLKVLSFIRVDLAVQVSTTRPRSRLMRLNP